MVDLIDVPGMLRNTWRDVRWDEEDIPEQGMDHAVMILRGVRSTELELQDLLPENLVVRVPHEAAYRQQAPLESSVIAQLFRGADVRVPETVRQAYARGTFHTDNPVMLTLSTEVTGRPLSTVWSSLSPAERMQAASQLGSLLATMHTMDPDLLPVRKVESWWVDGAATSVLSTAARSLPGKFALMRSRVEEFIAPRFPDATLSYIYETFTEVEALLSKGGQQRCLVHGDLHAGHILWEDSVGVIDFSDMTVGDPAVDYMHLGSIDPMLQSLVLAAVGDVYEGDDIAERAEIYRRWDEIFLLIDHVRTGRSEMPAIFAG